MARRDSAARAEAVSGGFAMAKKNIVVQYNGRERKTDNILQQIKLDAASKGIDDATIDEVDVYIKPEEQMIFYVINKQFEGCIPF